MERIGLVSRDFLSHVQQEFLIAGFHFREEPAQFGNVNGLAACASEFVILRRFQLVNRCSYFAVMKQAIHWHF